MAAAAATHKRKAPTDDDTAAAAAATATAPAGATASGSADSKHSAEDAAAGTYDGVKKARTLGPERPDAGTTVVIPTTDTKPAPLVSTGSIVPTAGLQTGGGTMVHVPDTRHQLTVASKVSALHVHSAYRRGC